MITIMRSTITRELFTETPLSNMQLRLTPDTPCLHERLFQIGNFMRAFSSSIMRFSVCLLAIGGMIAGVRPALAQDAGKLGGVNTSFHILGSHDVEVSYFTDPQLPVICYLSRAQTGGLKGAVGIAKNPTRFSLSCVKTGSAAPDFATLPKQQNITKIRNSFVFTKLVITRMSDAEHNAVVYLVTSQGLIDGSPANTIAAISW